MALSLSVAGGGLLALAPLSAAAQQVLVDSELAQVSLDAYTAPATIGGRAQLTVKLGTLDASLKAAVERGGSSLAATGEAWAAMTRPASWIGDQVELGATWSAPSGAKVTLSAGDRERQTLNYASSLADTDQLVTDAARFVRLNAGGEAGDNLDLRLGAEASTTTMRSRAVEDEVTSGGVALSTAVHKVFAGVTWRPASKVTVEAAQSVQSLGVAWRGEALAEAEQVYTAPTVAVTVVPWRTTRWRIGAEHTVSPVNPRQFASYAQIGGAARGAALHPDEGWRFAVRLEPSLPKGVSLSASAFQWRMNSVTELGPVGEGEAPVSVPDAERRQVEVNLAAPLEPLGFAGAKLTGQVRWQWSQVEDPFTGATRELSGLTPFQAQLQLSGGVYGSDLSWTLTARASGAQSVYQMSRITTVSPTTGLGGALTYGAGPVKISLEVDNLLGGDRTVTSSQYAGSRADGDLTAIDRREDQARAVRIALRRRL